jgi:hypothetical protein
LLDRCEAPLETAAGPNERRAAYLYYREVGERMGVKGWPAGYDEVAAFADVCEAEHFARTPSGARTAEATREL